MDWSVGLFCEWFDWAKRFKLSKRFKQFKWLLAGYIMQIERPGTNMSSQPKWEGLTHSVYAEAKVQAQG